uniref:Caspase recruitment domain-containing protein 19-like n=1 Tax=Salmo trutta TaxID=8032 RepID=A0A673X4R9_SALTR
MAAPWSGSDGYHVQLQRDSQFLCSDQRMHTELVDRLVLQLNRTYPQILTDKEAQRFRNLSVPTTVRLAELLVHLQGKGEEACHEFYRGLQIHAYNVYFNLPTRVSRRRGTALRRFTDLLLSVCLPVVSLSLFLCVSISVSFTVSFLFTDVCQFVCLCVMLWRLTNSVLCVSVLEPADPMGTNTVAHRMERYVLNDRGKSNITLVLTITNDLTGYKLTVPSECKC